MNQSLNQLIIKNTCYTYYNSFKPTSDFHGWHVRSLIVNLWKPSEPNYYQTGVDCGFAVEVTPNFFNRENIQEYNYQCPEGTKGEIDFNYTPLLSNKKILSIFIRLQCKCFLSFSVLLKLTIQSSVKGP